MRIRTQAPHEAVSPRFSLASAAGSLLPLGRRCPVGADEGAFRSWKGKVAPHQFGRMTYGRAIGHLQVVGNVHAPVSHGLTSSPPRGEGTLEHFEIGFLGERRSHSRLREGAP